MTDFFQKPSFASYEEFFEQFRILVPDRFNFAFDVVDEIAAQEPDRTALVWCDEKNHEATFTFAQMQQYSNRVANILVSSGIGKGDPVMLILKRRYEFWFALLALHKIGAVAIPATHLLSAKDIVYRNNAADIKMIVAVNDDEITTQVDAALPQSPSLKTRIVVGGSRDGWVDLNAAVEKASDQFIRPANSRATENSDPMLLYFTSELPACPRWFFMTSPTHLDIF